MQPHSAVYLLGEALNGGKTEAGTVNAGGIERNVAIDSGPGPAVGVEVVSATGNRTKQTGQMVVGVAMVSPMTGDSFRLQRE